MLQSHVRRDGILHPLWSCVLQSPVVSNVPMESHFKQLNQITLQKRTQIRPAEVVQSELTYDSVNQT